MRRDARCSMKLLEYIMRSQSAALGQAEVLNW